MHLVLNYLYIFDSFYRGNSTLCKVLPEKKWCYGSLGGYALTSSEQPK